MREIRTSAQFTCGGAVSSTVHRSPAQAQKITAAGTLLPFIEYLGEPRSRSGPRLFTNEHRAFHDRRTLKGFAFLSPDVPLTAFR